MWLQFAPGLGSNKSRNRKIENRSLIRFWTVFYFVVHMFIRFVSKLDEHGWEMIGRGRRLYLEDWFRCKTDGRTDGRAEGRNVSEQLHPPGSAIPTNGWSTIICG